ncbi:histidine phosphatase family protein [Lederbergia panacisoli]|uniref:histidine phosphatase family protein n=1 Tax=Lederbergia panacisoli TaxID=1255251 RepID=UPI00214C008F|nr:histidine phosphatase family protein [Lederbergia panacisoli]MCR2821257.1 histidine phosphatase family protein [Lederbergia panacisoli]
MTTICLIRHGETDWNALGRLQGRTDIPLNSTGVRQAEECRNFLKNDQWDLIVTSPLQRAKRTAEIINEGLQVELVEMEEFVERSFGDAEGMTRQEIDSAYPNRDVPNQEERSALNKRVMAGLEKINRKYGDKKALLVAHGGVINAILSILSDGEIGSGKTRLINACISNINFKDKKWLISDFNQVGHLSKFKELN